MTVSEYIVLKYIALCGTVRKADIIKKLAFLPVPQILARLKGRGLIDEGLENVSHFNALDFPYVYSLTLDGFHKLHESEKAVIAAFFKCCISIATVLLTALSLIH